MNTKCPKCELNNPSDSKFCKECGTQLTPSESKPNITQTLETPIQKLILITLCDKCHKDVHKIKDEVNEYIMPELLNNLRHDGELNIFDFKNLMCACLFDGQLYSQMCLLVARDKHMRDMEEAEEIEEWRSKNG